MMILTHPKSDAGFTLIELMLAVALLSLIMLILAGSFRTVAHSKIHGEDRLALDREARGILWQLGRELRGAVQTSFAPSRVVFVGQGHKENNKPLDSIAFSTLGPGHRRSLTNFGTEDLVTYSTKPNPKWRKCFILSRSQQSALIEGTLNDSSAAPVVMADNLRELHLRYFDGSQWQESWNSAAAANSRMLPLAVLIDLVLALPDGRSVQYSTEISIPMAEIMR